MCLYVIYVIPQWASSQWIEFHMEVTKFHLFSNKVFIGLDFYFLQEKSVDLYSVLFAQAQV
jgi:hypothetical protein